MRSEMAGGSVTRRQVLRAAGGTLVVGALGSQSVAAQEGCQGVATESAPEGLPEIDLTGEEPAASNLPEASELVVYLHGFNTTPEDGRKLAATFETALPADAPPVVAAPWRAVPAEENGGFELAEQQADEDGQKLAAWLAANAQDRTIRVVGYSLGTRTTLSAVDALAGEDIDLASVSLLGSAVPGAQVCAGQGYDLSAARAVFSYRSENDRVLCAAFAGYLLSSDADPPAVGCNGPECEDLAENFVDRDVSETIDNHCAYSYPEVGVVPQVTEDFTTQLSAVDTGSTGGQQQTATPAPTATETETDEETDTATPAGTEQTATDDGSGPGFGVGGALAGLGGVAYAVKQRLTDPD